MHEMFDIAGRTALVTGASSGLGNHFARFLAASGAKVTAVARRMDRLESLVADIKKDGGEATAAFCDVTDHDSIRAAIETAENTFGPLDILVNNAGATWGAPIEEFPEKGWDKVMDINVKGPFFLSQALLPLLEAAASPEDPARIINIGSIDGLNVNRFPTYSYGASKAAVHHLTRTLAAHLAERHITANAIAPGPFPGKMMAHTLETMGEEIRQGVPLKRIGEPADMAGAAIYLASRAGSYVSGVVLAVDGGIVASSRTL